MSPRDGVLGTATDAASDGPGGPHERRRRHTFGDVYHERTDFRFIDRSWRWLAISLVLVVVSVGALALRGLDLSIDFEGGTSWQVPVEGRSPEVDEVRDALRPFGLAGANVSVLEPEAGGLPEVRVQAEVLDDPTSVVRRAVADAAGATPADVTLVRAGAGATWDVEARGEVEVDVAALEAEVAEALGPDATVEVEGARVTVAVSELAPGPVQQVTDVLAEYAGVPVEEVTINTVGPTWGEQVTRKAVQALIVFFLLVAVYLSFRFEWKMAVAALVAVLHDIVVTVGFYAVVGLEVTPATVTAFLTILGFSLYDTVVVFDKVRENAASLLSVGRSTYSETVNRSLNQVLMRSLSTTIVALLPIASLIVVGVWILGAVALADFAIALFVGLFVGTYSSLFVAAPLLAWLKEREPKYAALRQRQVVRAGRPARPSARTASTGDRVTEGDEPVDPTPVAPGEQGGGAIAPRPRQQRRRKRR